MNSDSRWYLPLPEALVAIHKGEVDGDTFLRSMMYHGTWLVAGRHTDGGGISIGVIATPKGRILEVYSDREALERMELREGQEFTGEFLSLPGHRLFRAIQALHVDRVNLNPGDEPKLSYRGEQVELLTAWAEQVEVELALSTPDRVVNPMESLARFQNYHVVYERQGDANAIVLAPDTHGRALAAVFTSLDAAESFMAVMAPETAGTLEAVRLDARAAFEMVQRLNVQGMVFNPWTPLPARALQIGVIDELLARAAH